MKNHGRTSVSEIMGDFLVYRNLRPLDPRLPSLADLSADVGVRVGVTPRKTEQSYARVIAQILNRARAVHAPGVALERLIYLGDTRMNDVTAFLNIAEAGGWPGMAFIASEKRKPKPPQLIQRTSGRGHHLSVFLAQHWSALRGQVLPTSFERVRRDRGFPIDERTAVIIDLDKTALGARGRNDHVINEARVEAVLETIQASLDASLDRQEFLRAYDTLNEAEFHAFTADNQDYLAYVCLILGSGLVQLEALADAVRDNPPLSFREFIDEIDSRVDALPPSLQEVHRSIYRRFRAGDPTPFKAFRYNEYRATVKRMGCLPPGASVEELLAGEIVITQEVRTAALAWRDEGALIFGLSDKPDEASVPPPAMAEQGFESIHRVMTHAVGETIGKVHQERGK